ncbi:MAG: hypothetical protein GY861_17925 [bacterium]|nr:hypothetical protein [bacterium]
MGIISNNLLLEKGLRAEFMKAFNNGEDPQDVIPMIMTTQSNSDQEKYGWLGEVPQMREWLDERQLSGLPDYDYTIPNKDYEATLKVNRNVMDDDQLGATKVRVRDLSSRARTHSRKLFFDQLIAGDTEFGYDGVPFFSASHMESGAAQDNTYTGTGVTTAQFQADFIGARARMRSFKDNQGEPRNEGEMNDLIVVAHPDLEGTIDEVLSASMLNNTTNTLKGAAKKLISSRLVDTNDWYLMNAGGMLKPMVMQKREAIKFESLEKGERAFMRKELLFGVDYRVGFGFGVWHKAIKVTNA